MLCISMKPGDYFTVGDSTVVQFDRLHGERVCLMIQAPREVPILRGEVLERHGGQKPSCIQEKPARYVRQLPWNREKKLALQELREALERMDGGPEAQLLREKLDVIFPRPSGDGEAASL